MLSDCCSCFGSLLQFLAVSPARSWYSFGNTVCSPAAHVQVGPVLPKLGSYAFTMRVAPSKNTTTSSQTSEILESQLPLLYQTNHPEQETSIHRTMLQDRYPYPFKGSSRDEAAWFFFSDLANCCDNAKFKFGRSVPVPSDVLR